MAERIIQKDCLASYKDDLIAYSININRVRSIPNRKDSLKPVQRRNIYDLYNLGAINRSKKIKSARVVGDVMGKFHPHGDSSIYGSLEPLAVPWKCKVPIISGEGNWGNVIGNSPAAMRYTEVALSQFGYECVIGELAETDNTVDWSKNFDGTEEEPDFLPVKVPLLLVNGSSGIGLGISCDIPKHNLVEVINATRELIAAEIEAWDESQRTGKEVLPRNVDVVLVPDHCLPAKIIDTDWEKICNTGSGSYRIRGNIDINTDNKGNQEIIIRSIPDTTNTETIMKSIDDLIVNKHLPMIKDCIDVSDNGNVCIKIQLKKGSDPNYVREILYKRTNCEMSCTVNFEVVDGLDLKRISYKEYLQGFIVDRALTKFRLYANKLQKAMTRWHKLDAYTKALDSGEIDTIINMIRKRKSTDDNDLIEYLIKKLGITDMQAIYIINANLKQLSMGYLNKYKEECKNLWENKMFYEKMILDKGLILREIDQELAEIAAKYGQPRLCRVIKASDDSNIPKGTFKLIITENNFIRKIIETEKATSVRGDNPKFITLVDNTENVLLFDNKGRVYKLPVHKIPISEKGNAGIDVRMAIKGLTADIISVMYEPVIHKVAKLKEKHFVTIVTENNYIKKLDIQDFINVPPSGIIYTKLNGEDSVKSIEIISDKLDVIIYSQHKALRVPMQEVPCYKRISMGVLAMNTSDKIGGLSVVYPNAEYILVVSSSGKINKYNISGLDKSARYKAGSSVIKLGKTDEIYAIYGVSDSNILRLIMKESATPIIIPVKDVPVMSSVSTGTKMVNIKNDKIIRSDILLTLDQM